MAQDGSGSVQELPHSGYTLVQQQITIYPNQRPTIDSVTVRYRASDGNFVEVKDNGERRFLAFSNNGKYLRLMEDASGSHLVQVGSHNEKLAFDEDALQRAPNLREEQPIEWIAGVKCIVTRIENSNMSMDIYFAPSLGIPLQTTVNYKNTGMVITIRPVALEFGEPDRKVFEDLPVTLPVKTLSRRC